MTKTHKLRKGISEANVGEESGVVEWIRRWERGNDLLKVSRQKSLAGLVERGHFIVGECLLGIGNWCKLLYKLRLRHFDLLGLWCGRVLYEQINQVRLDNLIP